MHQHGIFHLDIKPENILYKENGDICIIDFGSATEQVFAVPVNISKLFSPIDDRMEMGTIRCEMWDSYSLGCILYHLTTGQYLEMPLERRKANFLTVVRSAGWLVADLILKTTR